MEHGVLGKKVHLVIYSRFWHTRQKKLGCGFLFIQLLWLTI